MSSGFFIPYYGIYLYLKSFEPTGYKEGFWKVFFGFFLSGYHALFIGLPIGFLISFLY
jgi:ABC-type phosphate transport system permease subunit